MERKYTEIEIMAGYNIEAAVKELLKYKKHGKLVCADFNGHTLYSDTVTVDSAYLEITGKTKTDYDKEKEQIYQTLIRKQKEHESKIPELTEEWIKRGHKIIDEKYWSEWDKCVSACLRSVYGGMELEACIEIIEPLNNGCDFREAGNIFIKQNHSGASNMRVKEMVKMFCIRGKEFTEFVNQVGI